MQPHGLRILVRDSEFQTHVSRRYRRSNARSPSEPRDSLQAARQRRLFVRSTVTLTIVPNATDGPHLGITREVNDMRSDQWARAGANNNSPPLMLAESRREAHLSSQQLV